MFDTSIYGEREWILPERVACGNAEPLDSKDVLCRQLVVTEFTVWISCASRFLTV